MGCEPTAASAADQTRSCGHMVRSRTSARENFGSYGGVGSSTVGILRRLCKKGKWHDLEAGLAVDGIHAFPEELVSSGPRVHPVATRLVPKLTCGRRKVCVTTTHGSRAIQRKLKSHDE